MSDLNCFYDYAMFSCPGSRDYNEDCIQMHDRGDMVLFALADGLGGMGGGRIASSLAVQSVIGRFRWKEGKFALEDAMSAAQKAVLYGREKHPEAAQMSSTLVLLSVTGEKACWAHIGDSRLYMFRKGRLAAQTEDHSVPQMLVKMGEITQAQVRHHPDRNRLLRTLGWEQEEQRSIVRGESGVEKGDAFLLCTDGFWEYISESEMEEKLRICENAAAWMKAMRRVVEKNGRGRKMDNYSAVCVRIL